VQNIKLIFFILIVLLLNLFNLSWGNTNLFVGEGEFLSVESDSRDFIKKQLKYSALKDVLNRYFEQMDLNAVVFWQIYESKITNKLENERQKYDKRLDLARKANNFEKILELETKWRLKRLSKTAQFLESKRIFQSFSILSSSESLTNPRLKFLSIKVRLNKAQLRKLFFEITKGDFERKFKNLFVSFHIKYESGQTGDFSNELSQLSEAIYEKWRTWLKEKYANVFESVHLVRGKDLENLRFLIESPPGQMAVSPVKASSIFGGLLGEEFREKEQLSYKNSMWLDLMINVEKLQIDMDFGIVNLTVGGGHIFFDLNGRSIVSHSDYEPKEKRVYIEEEDLIATFGTLLFNLPLKDFRENAQSFSKIPNINNQIKLRVKNVDNLDQLFGLNEFLNLSGANLNLKSSEIRIETEDYLLDLDYYGSREEVTNKFLEWETKLVTDKKEWAINLESDPVELQLKDRDLSILSKENEDDIKQNN